VHLRRGNGGQREVAEIALLERVGDGLAVRSAWTAEAGFGSASALLRRRLGGWSG
jgi:hypothetical protein